ncbi:MAG: Holliday junction branch migration protein RuvA [Rikenellaceae bacterium]
MYDYIIGKLTELQPTYAVIENNGIGYYINISLQSFSSLSNADEAKLYTQQYAVRDELPVLYGFYLRSEREMFRLLIGVSGVGGNTARVILSTFTPNELQTIISSGNSKLLKSAKGLGIKTSEKIIVELRDKMSLISPEGEFNADLNQNNIQNINNEVADEAISALTMLGFNRMNSSKVVKAILAEKADTKVEDVIRIALKKL